jgi:hypothetical protein
LVGVSGRVGQGAVVVVVARVVLCVLSSAASVVGDTGHYESFQSLTSTGKTGIATTDSLVRAFLLSSLVQTRGLRLYALLPVQDGVVQRDL